MDKKWKKIAKENYKALEGVNPDKATKDQYLLYAACVALLDHFEYEDESTHPTPETAAQGENEGAGGILLDYMADELADAEKYLKLWHETGNKDFKEIAKQELSHFETLAKYARTVERNIDLSPYMVHHNALMAKLS